MNKASTKSQKVLLFSDIHGNLPALEAVFDDVRSEPIDDVWNLGDITGYVPFPVRVVELLDRRQVVSIIGNYDRKVLAFKDCQDQWKKDKRSDKYAAFEWNHKQLSAAGRRFLESLPESFHVRMRGLDFTLVHTGEDADGTAITPETPAEYLANLARAHDTDVLLFGHSHIPMVRRVESKVFINPGSVGVPNNGDLRASYAILTVTDGQVEAHLRHVEYDIARVIRAMRAVDRSQALIDLFREPRNAPSPPKTVPAPSEKVLLDQVLALAARCHYEREHTEQVTRLALGIFDGLAELHGMGQRRRFQLHCGALLHDIGWLEGQKGHHKTALRLIVQEPGLHFDQTERFIIGLIARYHRKALPKPTHRYMGDLAGEDRDAVEKLAAILRIADGLDRTHTNAISETDCRFDQKTITIQGRAQGPATAEIEAAADKAELMRRAFGREVTIGPFGQGDDPAAKAANA
jgi:putative phosphoesterase